VIGEPLRSMSVNTHLQRMSGYCALLGERMGLDAEMIRAASRLHDVGMAGAPDAVIWKPGPLTAEERREMQEHAQLGFAMLTGSGVDLLETAATIARTHHERWDGAGYPQGLAGDDIPLPGRIVAVADTFDALTTPRIYRGPGSVEDAITVLTSERGAQFDAAVVDVFVDRLDEMLEIHERFPAPHGERNGDGRPAEVSAQMTLQAAAATLAISPSRLRRWADEGRIPAIRTAGGHRRFPLEAVRRLAAERGLRPNVKPVEPPETALPLLAQHVRAQGRQMASAAAMAVYREGPPGWFASERAAADLAEWLDALEAGCATGRYAGVVQASEALMRRAHLHAASLLERHAFLERFGQAAAFHRAAAGAAGRAASRVVGLRHVVAACP
jgi:excisionase family DNA binding protein